MMMNEIFGDQAVIIKGMPCKKIENFLLVQATPSSGVLEPATDPDFVIGIAKPKKGPVNGIIDFIEGQTDVCILGRYLCKISTDVKAGQLLTLDTSNPGQMKLFEGTGKVFGIALEDGTAGQEIQVLFKKFGR